MRWPSWLLISLLAGCAAAPAADPRAPAETPVPLEAGAAARFAALALKCLHAEYPNHLSHALASDADARPPRELTPAFYGCYDWHSDVHGHWLLVRLVHLFPEAPFAPAARAAVDQSLTAPNIAGELAYLRQEDRASFERPYGLAWLLALCAELRGWDDPQAQRWLANLQPLETEAATRLTVWTGKLHYPIRVGEHDQTAFSFSLVWDWAGVAGDAPMRSVLAYAARRFYMNDRNCPLNYEPSGEDFLSPCLGEADFMRRVLGPEAFGRWLGDFLPDIPTRLNKPWLEPGIAHGLKPGDRRIKVLLACAQRHRDASLTAVTGEHYVGRHWLGTFAVYLTSGAGLH
jgi:hypothetical protein